jgi:hypothetical protein
MNQISAFPELPQNKPRDGDGISMSGTVISSNLPLHLFRSCYSIEEAVKFSAVD